MNNYIVPGPSLALRKRMKAMLERQEEARRKKISESLKKTLNERKAK